MNEYKMILGQNIKTMRKKNNYSQEYLSAEAKISLSNYREIEHGKANPTIDTLSKIADKFGVYVGMLFEKPEEFK